MFSNETVAGFVTKNFEPCWEMVRPVPIVRIDFGNGTVITRTLHGNIASYVCTADGQVLDVVPGIYNATGYLDALDQLRLLADAYRVRGDQRAAYLEHYHQSRVLALKNGDVPPRLLDPRFLKLSVGKSVAEFPVESLVAGGKRATAVVEPVKPPKPPAVGGAWSLSRFQIFLGAPSKAALERVIKRFGRPDRGVVIYDELASALDASPEVQASVAPIASLASQAIRTNGVVRERMRLGGSTAWIHVVPLERDDAIVGAVAIILDAEILDRQELALWQRGPMAFTLLDVRRAEKRAADGDEVRQRELGLAQFRGDDRANARVAEAADAFLVAGVHVIAAAHVIGFARAHGADEDARVQEVVREPDAVAQQGPAGERAGGVDREHGDLAVGFPHLLRQRADADQLVSFADPVPRLSQGAALSAAAPDARDGRRPPAILVELVNDFVALHRSSQSFPRQGSRSRSMPRNVPFLMSSPACTGTVVEHLPHFIRTWEPTCRTCSQPNLVRRSRMRSLPVNGDRIPLWCLSG